MSSDTPPPYRFFRDLARTLNAGLSRSVVLAGEIHDLYHLEDTDRYEPLLTYLCRRCAVPGVVVLVYELNGPIRCLSDADRRRLRDAWVRWKSGHSPDELILQALTDRSAQARRESLEEQFDRLTEEATGRPTAALEFLRQLSLCSRAQAAGRDPFRLLILIEAADMLLPAGDGEITRLGAGDRQRVAICQDWFADAAFAEGADSVVLLTDSRSGVHPRIAALPQVHTLEVPAPDVARREHFIRWFAARHTVTLGMPPEQLAGLSAGLSIHALRQLLLAAVHRGEPLEPAAVVEQLEHFIVAQLGEGVVGFSKPEHTLEHVVGNTRLKAFLQEEMLPRLRATGESALPGAVVAGPIGSGKTFLFEALAGSLGLPVLVLKNIRSPYFGQTDVLFEKLRRVLESLGKVIVFVDEADTQFGGVGADAHETERRLTGKIQALMSDPRLRGRVVWLLMTARIEALSPDLRRPGRVGDLILPVLDPEPGGADAAAFLDWTVRPALEGVAMGLPQRAALEALTRGYSAAAYGALRSQLQARRQWLGSALTGDQVLAVAEDLLPADIGAARRYQTLQALLNCTRRSLLPDPGVDEATRAGWRRELALLAGA